MSQTLWSHSLMDVLNACSSSSRISAHLSAVRVRSVRVDALVVDDVLEGFVHEAAVAAKVSVLAPRTVHQVLGAQVHQLPCGLG